MELLPFPINSTVCWIVIGWAFPYGSARALLTNGSNASTERFDEGFVARAIFFGWPVLCFVVSYVGLSVGRIN